MIGKGREADHRLASSSVPLPARQPAPRPGPEFVELFECPLEQAATNHLEIVPSTLYVREVSVPSACPNWRTITVTQRHS
jgi:hypothetical protein